MNLSKNKKQLNMRLEENVFNDFNSIANQLGLSFPDTIRALTYFYKTQKEELKEKNNIKKKINNLTKQTNIIQYYNSILLKIVMESFSVKFDKDLLNFSLKNQPSSLDETTINIYNEIEKQVIDDFRFIKLNNNKPSKINSNENSYEDSNSLTIKKDLDSKVNTPEKDLINTKAKNDDNLNEKYNNLIKPFFKKELADDKTFFGLKFREMIKYLKALQLDSSNPYLSEREKYIYNKLFIIENIDVNNKIDVVNKFYKNIDDFLSKFS